MDGTSMSLLRYKQKLYPLGMGNPQGGGGGIIDSIGSAVGDVVESIGSGLASIDKAVNQVPGGWITVGGLAAGGVALVYAPEVMAAAAAEGVAPEVAAAELGIPGVEVPAAEGVAGGTSTGTGLTTGSGATGITGGGTGVGSIAAPATNTGLIDATGAAITAPAASGANTLAGIGGGLTAEEAAAAQAAQIASQMGGGVTASDVLSAANRARSLGNLLTGGITGKPNAQQFAQFQALNQPVQEQFGGLYRMNQNPFVQTQQPTTIQNPLGKTQDFLAQLAEEGKPTPTLADLLRTT
jgi:hypothetical protein